MKVKTAFQDGGEFYDSRTGRLIVSYAEMVKDDYDMKGSTAARRLFKILYPEYKLERG